MLVLLVVGALPALGRAAPEPAAATPDAIAALLRGDGDLRIAKRSLDRVELLSLYEPRQFAPIWTAERQAALTAALAEAESHGLDRASYGMPEAPAAERELLLTDTFLRYAAALAHGRVAPAEIESDWTMSSPAFDPAKVLARALDGSVAGSLAALAPSDPAYERLRQALARYRDYAAASRWRPLALTVPMKLGDSGDGVDALRERLAAEGFAAGAGDGFDDALAAAVKRFQAAHGLGDDGAVGRATLAALNVTPAARVKEIKLNLERWRSLPRNWPETRVEVNVPSATATLYEPGEAPLAMHAIVGAPQHPTPVLRARMTSILLNPPWKVPSSIIENEIRPALKRDKKYLEHNDFVYVEVEGGRELQQLPGPKNALGMLKFEMPNPDDIYLHDTPARTLFRRAGRAMSHGCIRLEHPRALAERVLEGAPDWPRAALDDAIATGATQRIALPHAVPVYIVYFTAIADEDGTVEFDSDVYGRDRRLAAALDAGAEAPPRPTAKAVLTKHLSTAAQ
ncbi:MAG TPA: L,D-transpeptidase family protein [Stellaceae bacterium]|nr:L,D-transpeptidase family protein [Stellaceae bacterium]